MLAVWLGIFGFRSRSSCVYFPTRQLLWGKAVSLADLRHGTVVVQPARPVCCSRPYRCTAGPARLWGGQSPCRAEPLLSGQ